MGDGNFCIAIFASFFCEVCCDKIIGTQRRREHDSYVASVNVCVSGGRPDRKELAPATDRGSEAAARQQLSGSRAATSSRQKRRASDVALGDSAERSRTALTEQDTAAATLLMCRWSRFGVAGQHTQTHTRSRKRR